MQHPRWDCTFRIFLCKGCNVVTNNTIQMPEPCPLPYHFPGLVLSLQTAVVILSTTLAKSTLTIGEVTAIK